MTFKHKVKHRIKHIRQSQDIDVYESVEGDTEPIQQLQVSIEPPSPSEKKTIHPKSPSPSHSTSPSGKLVYHLLPFSEPKTKDCGTFVKYNFGHLSKVPDRKDEFGDLVHSVHTIGPKSIVRKKVNGKFVNGRLVHGKWVPDSEVPPSMQINCGSILCEYCNFRHDLNGNIIYDDQGHPVPNGAWKKTIDSHTDKLKKFKELTGQIAKSDNAIQNFNRLFYGKKQTHHAQHDIFYTLTDKKMGIKQKRNLNYVIRIASHHGTPFSVYHHMLSPPSTWDGWENEAGIKHNIDRAIDLLREVGCFGGYVYFHPYRIPGQFNDRVECAVGPHFHFVGFSHIMADVEQEIYEREGVVIKALHHHNGHVEPVNSIEKTIAYITSHTAVQRTREPIVRDLELLEKYHHVEVTEAVVEGKQVTFILPNRESNFDNFNFPDKKLTISPEVFRDSLSYFTFLKTDGGRLFLLMRRHIKSILDEGDRIKYQYTMTSNLRKKDRKLVMRNFGILSNSKNFIWKYKKPKKEYYCELCADRIPLADMFPCRVLTESLVGIKGPPPEPGKDADIMEDLEYTEALQAYNDRLHNVDSVQEKIQNIKDRNIHHNLEKIDHKSNKDGWDVIGREDTTIYIDSDSEQYLKVVPPQELHKYYKPSSPGSEIYQIPLEYVQRLDINFEDAVRHFYRTRN